jgi:acyl dehydratase
VVERRHLEDFGVGQLIVSPNDYEMTPERIAAYAAEYDPQPIHLEPEVAAREMFGSIVASGWHSLSVTMRLMVESRLFAGAPVVGVSIAGLRFLQPVRAGDRLRAQAEVLEIRPSRSRPESGYLVVRITTLRQDGVPVLTQDWTLLVPRRPG